MSKLRGLSAAVRLAIPITARACRCIEHAVLPALSDPAQRSGHLLIRSSAASAEVWQGSFAVRPISSSTAALQQQEHDSEKQRREAESRVRLRQQQEEDAITDQIPLRPMGKVEGASYTLIIVAALGLAAAVLYTAGKELLGSPKEFKVFDLALDKLRDDPRITTRIGPSITGYGSNTMNRRQRRHIANRQYEDGQGLQHTQVQFFIRGAAGQGQVSCDMYQDANRTWQTSFLFVDVEGAVMHGRLSPAQRIVLVDPQMAIA